MHLTTKGLILKKFFLVLLLAVLGAVCGPGRACVLALGLTMPELARYAAESFLKGQQVDYRKITLQSQDKRPVAGVFVTVLDEQNKSRGCWGKLYPQEGLTKSIIYGAVGAIKKDYRYKPLKLSELPQMKFQVSLVRKVIPVNSVKNVNPYKDGMLVQSGSRGGVLMPGEVSDAYYQMVQCKLKAGIKPEEQVSIFKLVTDTYKD